MKHLAALKHSGHWPSLLAAFLHFDLSFTVWVILGALAPFIAADALLTGPNLRLTPLPSTPSGRYVVVITGFKPANHEPRTTYHLAIKTKATAGDTGAKPVESFALDNTRPATLAALNAHSRFIRITLAEQGVAAPHEQSIPLKSAAQLRANGKHFQVLGNGLSAGAKGVLVAIPLLGAALFRILLGLLADRYGSKRVGAFSMAATLVPLFIGWQFASTYGLLLCMGAFLGLAGASFAVSLPLASRWYPPHLQGLALGIAGAGNSGTVLATLCAPLLAGAVGWHGVLGLLMVPVGVVLVVFVLLARDAPVAARPHPLASYRMLLRRPETFVFCLLYFITFGGFVGFSSFLNTFFVDQYGVSTAAVGLATVPFVLAGSALRPVGGGLADWLGGIRMLSLVFVLVTVSEVGIGLLLHDRLAVSLLLVVMMGCLGMGNGSVFQLIPQRFGSEIGAVTGLVGAVGGIGGFYLNIVLGGVKDHSGTYATGFYLFALSTTTALVILRLASQSWSWLGAGGRVHSGHDRRVAVGRPLGVGEPG